ncbi:MAG: helix-turn-helix transcriptional regulator [Pseudohongiella sp.]|nr:helix-turn-helix transcriptional regulator [Pseudohongiella sp.]MDO9520146.1 helix-turn-helix transcriptional regulator [Pseudohongiella sp.]
MAWIHSASSFLAISQLLFLACLYLVYFPGKRLAHLIALFSVCVISYILARQAAMQALPIIEVLRMLAIAAPAVLWIVARYLFEDDQRIHPLIWVMIIAYMTLRLTGQFMFEGPMPRSSATFIFLFFLPQLIMLALACHVVYMACRGRESDLVELRRQLRVPFAIGMGSIVGLIIGAGFFWDGSQQTDSLYFFLMFLLILFINLGMFQIHKDTPQLIQMAGELPKPSMSAAEDAEKYANGHGEPAPGAMHVSRQDQVMIDRVLKAMQQERLYAESGLTIGDLAERVSVQEYRLRKLINQSLHYRNFNQFLNQYRIEEAARRLLDPAQEHIPISSIALDVGYASLSSFNKAFKETHGVTPSVYRSGQAE